MTHGAGRQARGAIRRMLKHERAEHRQHLRDMKRVGKCMADCPARHRWNVAHEILLELLEKCGGRPTTAEREW